MAKHPDIQEKVYDEIRFAKKGDYKTLKC